MLRVRPALDPQRSLEGEVVLGNSVVTPHTMAKPQDGTAAPALPSRGTGVLAQISETQCSRTVVPKELVFATVPLSPWASKNGDGRWLIREVILQFKYCSSLGIKGTLIGAFKINEVCMCSTDGI